jgi:hypothetical protein
MVEFHELGRADLAVLGVDGLSGRFQQQPEVIGRQRKPQPH